MNQSLNKTSATHNQEPPIHVRERLLIVIGTFRDWQKFQVNYQATYVGGKIQIHAGYGNFCDWQNYPVN